MLAPRCLKAVHAKGTHSLQHEEVQRVTTTANHQLAEVKTRTTASFPNVIRGAKPNGADKLFRRVVKGMLPKNKLGAKLLTNLYVYEGGDHKHEAQSPKAIDINLLK